MKKRTRNRETVRKRALRFSDVSDMRSFDDLKDGSNRDAPIANGAPRINIDDDKLIALSAWPNPPEKFEAG